MSFRYRLGRGSWGAGLGHEGAAAPLPPLSRAAHA